MFLHLHWTPSILYIIDLSFKLHVSLNNKSLMVSVVLIGGSGSSRTLPLSEQTEQLWERVSVREVSKVK